MKQNDPPWLDHGSIDEIIFCQEFLQKHPMICVNDAFFTMDGRIHDESGLRHQIFEKLKPHVAHGLPKKVSNLLDVLKMECHSTPPPIHHDRIHVANGTYFLDGTFLYQRTFSVELSQKIHRGMDLNAEKCLSNGSNPGLASK